MILKLYQYSGDNRVVNKAAALGTPYTMTGTLRDECDVMTPAVLVGTDPRGYNFAQIEAFGRYYYVEEITAVRSGLWRIACKVDPLASFAADIAALPGIARRSQKRGSDRKPKINSYLYDSKQQKQVNCENVSESLYHFDYETNGTLILGAVGGSGIWGV